MKILTKNDLLSPEDYAKKRNEFRTEVIAIRKNRSVMLGESIRLLFENQQTIQYQIQEMLRIEKIFEVAEIQEELDTYNPLIPTGNNLKATMILEYSNEVERKQKLSQLLNIEKNIYFQIGNHQKVFAICNEDLERQTEDKTSSVHFMRFELNATMIKDFHTAKVEIIANHANYQSTTILSLAQKELLALDFKNNVERCH
ncbi:Hypothetical protein i Rubrerythrin cluster [uncultured Gammaproteobacteria bacterium]|uniref:DUF3501 family protein n=1 Tax=Bathymodiolus heckerae thiotrophic gill symbiont TaxID=1052212 RepID=UPI0010B35884|nr:DUF3501 family protein [Bathymodiolus heckerae thiotrophic gill symbiont]CAC9534967.1 Hypothetical protein i Rubrerythrin cluster [uncultured Gammaproteobacteria bacterium]CAC9592042.1 Hypothetical protein i Rubrerythrin cluster [uncultured Gammaproteobacteria bacterium]CAC9952620.1 Hypothetical protein i Rubrerythrin cluster [uncultured Gammaproteobacteria bacterium]SHN89587.1 Hypothetical protein i Rubrerythrin cluster [Bathymodiolus heckerae thiotrophic gill symbiont]